MQNEFNGALHPLVQQCAFKANAADLSALGAQFTAHVSKCPDKLVVSFEGEPVEQGCENKLARDDHDREDVPLSA